MREIWFPIITILRLASDISRFGRCRLQKMKCWCMKNHITLSGTRQCITSGRNQPCSCRMEFIAHGIRIWLTKVLCSFDKCRCTFVNCLIASLLDVRMCSNLLLSGALIVAYIKHGEVFLCWTKDFLEYGCVCAILPCTCITISRDNAMASHASLNIITTLSIYWLV